MTNRALWSIAIRPPETVASGDTKTVQVRTRSRRHAQLVIDILSGIHREVLATPEHDYEFRVYVTPVELVELLTVEAARVNYAKFKPTVREKRLHRLYLKIWWDALYAYSSRKKIMFWTGGKN
jgi:hypothetical protein